MIFVGNLDEVVDKIGGFEAGGVDYIIKLFHNREVLARVKTHLAFRRLQREAEAQNERLEQEVERCKQVEEELQKARGELERRVVDRAGELKLSKSI